MKSRFFCLAITITALSLAPAFVNAAVFNKNFIISDFDQFDKHALSQMAIQTFLEKKGSMLATITDTFSYGIKKVSEIIWLVSQETNISPKFLLAKLQNEQGLIEKASATQNALDWAMGYSCFGGRCNEKYRGIANQIDAGATTFRIYSDQPNRFGFKIGVPSITSDGYQVTPQNQATANLYIYTPYHGSDSGIGGNYSFWKVWNRYFGGNRYPDGIVLLDPDGTLWKIQNGERRKYISKTAYLQTNRIEDAIQVSADIIASYPESTPIKFSNYAVVKDSGSGKIYLLVDDFKRHIVSPEALRKIGFNPEEIETVLPEDIAPYRDGFPIDETAVDPTGVVAKNKTTGELFFLQNGFKYPIIDDIILKLNYPNRTPKEMFAEEINSGYPGNPVPLKNGLLVKDASHSIYMISERKKFRIASDYTFQTLFPLTQKDTIQSVPQKVLDIHPDGETIEIAENIPDAPDATSNPQQQENTYTAVWKSTSGPNRLKPNEKSSLTLTFANTGTGEWRNNSTFLSVTNEKGEPTPLAHESWSVADGRFIPMETVIGQNSQGTFSIPLKAPANPGEYGLLITLKRIPQTGSPEPIAGGSLLLPINVIPNDYTAEIGTLSMPPATKNTWRKTNIEVKIKNTGTQKWAKKQLILIVEDTEGKTSPFYDSSDWIDKRVAALPLDKGTTIDPGKTATLKFTLKPKGLPKGTYTIRFRLELKDAKQTIPINTLPFLDRKIRVD